MGWFQPSPPPFDLDEWRAKPYLERLKPCCQDWAVNGFGTPYAIYFLYLIKLVVFSVGAFLVISLTTPGVGGLNDISDWWTQPLVFQKIVVWTMLWEILGLGSGSMPLAFRFSPMIGGVLYWLRPGTIRLAPWPDRVPLTAGSRRTIADVALYGGVLASLLFLLLSDGDAGLLDRTGIVVALALLCLLGLRDKVSFLAARPEVYGFMLVVSLFAADTLIVGWQLVMVCIWLGAASSKLNHHFPYVISVMISNTPWNRSPKMKEKLWVDWPNDVRPSQLSAFSAHLGTVWEMGWPVVLLLSSGGTIGTIAVIAMVLFHIHITSTFALGVPLEWNLFMIFGLLFLFGHYGDVPLSTLDPLLLAVILVVGVLIPILGNLFPDKFSFLPAMRYYAGNWATSKWMFRKSTDAEGKFDRDLYKVAPLNVNQLKGMYDDKMSEYLIDGGLAFRALHSHGRALTGLLNRAAPGDVDEYEVREGELISGLANGWNFGDGHFHHKQLLDAVQEQVQFAEGEVRVIALESQPAQIQRQRYRIYDAATGLIEEGWVNVADMRARGPWLDGDWDFPVEVINGRQAKADSAAVS
jgi:hypothetical protein